MFWSGIMIRKISVSNNNRAVNFDDYTIRTSAIVKSFVNYQADPVQLPTGLTNDNCVLH